MGRGELEKYMGHCYENPISRGRASSRANGVQGSAVPIFIGGGKLRIGHLWGLVLQIT